MMTKEQITNLCADKRNELLSKYFGNLVHEAVYDRQEEIDEGRYSPELPSRVASEYYDFLKQLLIELRPGNQNELSVIMNKKSRALSFMVDDRQQLDDAYRDAKFITLWEKITKSNHEDVTYYKGLLKAYTAELLDWMQLDFIEDACK